MARPNGGLPNLEASLHKLSISTDPEVLDHEKLTSHEHRRPSDRTNPTSPEKRGVSPFQTPDSGVALSRTPSNGTGRYYNNGEHGVADGGNGVARRLNYGNYPRGNFRQSRTWMSEDAKNMQDFQIVRNAMRRLFRFSDVAKWRYADWIAHKEAMLASQKAQLDKKLKTKEENLQAWLALTEKAKMEAQAIGDDVMKTLCPTGNRGLVLGEQTIWCENWQDGKDDIAPWPDHAEAKWEGDDRAKTGVGRFLPLPREPGAPGIQWGQLQVIEQYPMDQVARIPTMEDIYLPVDEIDDEVKYDLITKDLEDAMDAYLET